MVTLTNTQAMQAHAGLTELAGLLLPPAGALRIRRITRELRAHLQDVEAERKKLIEAHAARADDGRIIALGEDGKPVPGGSGVVQFANDEARAAFDSGYTALMSATWETEYPVRASDLGTSAAMRAETLLALGELLEEPEEAT